MEGNLPQWSVLMAPYIQHPPKVTNNYFSKHLNPKAINWKDEVFGMEPSKRERVECKQLHQLVVVDTFTSSFNLVNSAAGSLASLQANWCLWWAGNWGIHVRRYLNIQTGAVQNGSHARLLKLLNMRVQTEMSHQYKINIRFVGLLI